MGVFKIAIKIQDGKWLVEVDGSTHSLPDFFWCNAERFQVTAAGAIHLVQHKTFTSITFHLSQELLFLFLLKKKNL